MILYIYIYIIYVYNIQYKQHVVNTVYMNISYIPETNSMYLGLDKCVLSICLWKHRAVIDNFVLQRYTYTLSKGTCVSPQFIHVHIYTEAKSNVRLKPLYT